VDEVLKAVLELLFEIALKLPGCAIVKCFRPKAEIEPDGCLVVVCGLVFWLLVGLSIWAVVVLV
jgi:hypothetical protein